ncbi:MAG: LysM peptidoglycan-binding domain-containing protein, partial [Clostridia bacterium]
MAQTIYVVQPGDTVYNIAQKFDVPVEGIVILNDLENPSQIQVGQQLRIPAYLQATVLYEEVPIYQQPVQESEEWGRVRAGTHLQVLGVVEEFYQVTYL